jgi:hypothetical protein
VDDGLIKLLVLFGIVLALAVWELYRVSRSLEADGPSEPSESGREYMRGQTGQRPDGADGRDR